MSRQKVMLLLLGGLLVSGCASRPRLSAWVVDPLIKVFPGDLPGSQENMRRSRLLPRNGHASVQIALRSRGRISDLRVAVELPPGIRSQVRRVGYVPVGSNPPDTPYDEVVRAAPALYPDPLLEDFPFTLPAAETTAVWITLYAPSGTTPGEYMGRVQFASGDRILTTASFNVRVMAATVPERQTLKVTNWLTLGREYLRQYFPLDGDPESYWKLVGNIGRVMADHRQNVLLTPVFSLVKPALQNGRIRYDFTDLDLWVDVFEKAGLIGTIEGGHLLGRSSGYDSPMVIPAYVVEGGRVVQKRLMPGDPRAEQFLDGFLGALNEHLTAKRWRDRYIQHIHDEPHGNEGPIYARYAAIIRRNLPAIPTIDAVSLQQDIRFFTDVCDIWVPVLGSFDALLPLMRTHVEKGGEGWFYTCIFPQGRHLNRFIDYPLLKVRLLHWFNFRHNLTGFLHWGGNHWPPKPFLNVQPVLNDNTTLLPAGDHAIIYPNPAGHSVLSSIRLEAMREGIEDYELLVALSGKDAAKAAALAQTAIPNVSDYLRDVGRFRDLERQLLEALP